MTAVTKSPAPSNFPYAFESSTRQVEDALCGNPLLTAYRHAFRPILLSQSPVLHGHNCRIAPYSLKYDSRRPGFEPEVEVVSVVHPKSTQQSSRTDSRGNAAAEALETLRQKQEAPV